MYVYVYISHFIKNSYTSNILSKSYESNYFEIKNAHCNTTNSLKPSQNLEIKKRKFKTLFWFLNFLIYPISNSKLLK